MLIGALAEELPQRRSRSGGGSKVARGIGRCNASQRATHRQRYILRSAAVKESKQGLQNLQQHVVAQHTLFTLPPHWVFLDWALLPQLCNVVTVEVLLTHL
jgi:hypothetical protein